VRKKLLIEIAFLLYNHNVFSLGKAREFCGLRFNEFEAEMTKRNISRFREESLQQDIEIMNKLFRK
jgi:predicted HTH domain antitoxin